MKKCYWCGSVPHMLNYCDIIYNIARYQWFGCTENLQSRHQQAIDKGDEQTVESDAYVSLSHTKKSGWSGLQISLHGRKQVATNGSYLR